jgi:O-antigen ligase
LKIVLGAVALVLGLVIAYLVVSGNWMIGLGLIVAVPAIILLHNHPILGLAAWLMFVPFLVSDGLGSLRLVYWIIHRGLPLMTVIIMASIAIFSDDPATTVVWYYDRVIVPIFLYLLVRLLAPNEEDLRRLLPVFLFIVLTQSLFGFLYVSVRGVLPSAWLSQGGVRATGSLGGSESVYTVTVLFAAALVLHIGLARQRWDFWKLLSIAAFAAAMLAVFFSFSRAGWLAMMVLLGGLIYLYPKFMTRLALVGTPVVLLVAGGLLASQLDYASERLYSGDSEESALSRLPVILASIRMFEEKPAFGWGYGNFDRFDREFQGGVPGLYVPDKDHASHNIYLTILAEQGLSGLLLYLMPMLVLIPASVKRWKTMPRNGLWSRKLLLILWLLLATHVAVNNFSNMRIVFGLGLWWMTVALIAVMVFGPNRQNEVRSGSTTAPDRPAVK